MHNNDIAGRVRLDFTSGIRLASSALRRFALSSPTVPLRSLAFVTHSGAWKRWTLAATLAVAGFGAAHAQDTAVGFQAKRIDLQSRVSSLETELANPKLSSSKRKADQAEIAQIKNRLEAGDFKTGDLLVVTVNVEEKPSVDTATVRDNGMISISRVPDVSVAGVLRSEVQEKVKNHVATYFKRPEVRVNFTTRITVVGAIGRSGTFSVAPDRPLSEIIIVAGGGAPNAKVDQLEVKRAGKVFISKDQSKKLLFQGKTVAEVGIQNGDEVVIPGKRQFTWQGITQTVFLISSLTFALVNFLRYYYSEE